MARLIHSLRSIVSSPKKNKAEDQPPPPPHLDINRRISLKKLFTHLPIINTNNSLYNQSTSFHHHSTLNQVQPPHQREQLQPNKQPPPNSKHEQPNPRRSISEPLITTNNNNNPPPPQQQHHHNTPFHLITSKLRRQSSSSAAEPTDPDQTSSFSLKSFRNVRTTIIDSNSSTQQQQQQQQQPLHKPFSQSSLSLPLANPTSPTPARPPSVTTISRPCSPSSKISAAAFREARAARNSRSITPSPLPDPPSRPKLQPSASTNSKYIKHTRFKSSPQPNLSSNPVPRPSSLHANSSNSSIRNPLTLADLHRYQSFDSSDPSTRLVPNPSAPSTGLYNDNEVLIPPRPPFYGSRLSARSASSDPRSSLYYPPPSHHHDTGVKNRRPSTIVDTRSLYTHPFINQSSASVRSVPSTLIQPPTPSTPHPRRRSATTTKPQRLNSDQPQLEQWHSDEEDNHLKASTTLAHPLPKPIPQFHPNPTNSLHQSRPSVSDSDDVKGGVTNKPADDDDEDEVPLSKLKKKSFSSLRGTAAAQTLARERQQLHSISTNVKPTSSGFLQSPSPLGGSSHTTLPNHTRHISTSFLPAQRDSSINPSRYSKFISGHAATSSAPLSKSDGLPPIRTLLHPRGNSPASSSSGSGSGSGTWSIPITPRNSTGNLNLLLPPLPASTGHQHAHFLSNFNQSRFNASSPKSSTFDQPHCDMESIVSSGIPSKTPSKSRSLVNVESQKSLLHQEQQGVWNHHGVPVEDLSMPPAGVDHFLYSTLSIEQKIELHHQSEIVKQMMAAQAKAAVQMHAMALSSTGGGRKKTILDEGTGPILEYDPTRIMYNWSSPMDPTAFQPAPGPTSVPLPINSSSDDRRVTARPHLHQS